MFLNFTKHGFDLKFKNLSSIFMIFCTFRRISIDLCNKSFREIHQKDFKRCKQISLFRWWSMSPRQRPVVNSDSVWHYGSLLFLVVLLKHFYCPVLRDIVLLRITVLTSIILYDGAPSSPLSLLWSFSRYPLQVVKTIIVGQSTISVMMTYGVKWSDRYILRHLFHQLFQTTDLSPPDYPFPVNFPSPPFKYPAKKFIFIANIHTHIHPPKVSIIYRLSIATFAHVVPPRYSHCCCFWALS